MKKRGFAFSLILTFLFSGCVIFHNPVTKKKEYIFYSVEGGIDMGKAINKKIQKEYTLFPVPEK